jgi:transposase
MEYGIVIAQGISQVRRKLVTIIEDTENELSPMGRELFRDLHAQLYAADEKVAEYDERIKVLCRQNETCERLTQLPGVGALTATALVATIGDARVFKNGREMAAFIGLVPRQHSSGSKQVLLALLHNPLVVASRAFCGEAIQFFRCHEMAWQFGMPSDVILLRMLHLMSASAA